MQPMFFSQVYKHSKWLFVAFLAFALLQLAVFSRPAMVFSPFFNYGMYSAPIGLDSTYVITKFPALKASRLSAQQWDKVYVTLQRYANLSQNDSLYAQHICRLFVRANLPPPPIENFTVQLMPQDFNRWFLQYISQSTGQVSAQFALQSQTQHFRWNGNRLEPLQ
jgi:hypothetical protein